MPGHRGLTRRGPIRLAHLQCNLRAAPKGVKHKQGQGNVREADRSYAPEKLALPVPMSIVPPVQNSPDSAEFYNPRKGFVGSPWVGRAIQGAKGFESHGC